MKGSRFLLRNLIKGFLWLGVIIIAFVYIKENVDVNYYAWLEPIYQNIFLIYTIYSLSELIFGILPPELFMIWAATKFELLNYVFQITFFATLSYFAGIIGFLIGEFLNKSLFFRLSKKRILGRYEKYMLEYGGFLIIVAAVTPIPFSGIAMLMGSIKYSFRKYLWFSLLRFLRFFVYAYIIWETNIIY